MKAHRLRLPICLVVLFGVFTALPVGVPKASAEGASGDALVDLLEELRHDPEKRSAARESLKRRIEDLEEALRLLEGLDGEPARESPPGETAEPATTVAAAPDSSTIRFNRDIRPILSDTCFACHGPDKATLKAGLRLDLEDGSRAVIAPGDRAASELFHRIASDDPSERMPPAESGKSLTPEQIELLGRWIDEGANYEPHWAFVAPERPEPPAVEDESLIKNDIDRFIVARLEKEGLKPAEEADKTSLIRRVTLDLTGLPPTPEEVDAFLADDSPEAYEKVVDRLLASPRYGEHMARFWLDAARYADTNGYHIDNERYMWRWRDWVINAFNQNMPFDQFTLEQLAGDLLPNATLEQKIASGFNRNHMITFEGGIIPEEYRVAYVVDRVATTSTVWMGLTMSCAQCHDHKFDPISQKEFFEFYAFFNTVPENGSDGLSGNAVPMMKAPTPDQQEKLAAFEKEIAEYKAKLHQPLPEIDAAQAAWEKEQAGALEQRWTVLSPEEVKSVGGATPVALEDGSVRVEGDNPDHDTYEFVAQTDLTGITALRLEALTDESLPNGGTARFENGNFVLTEFEVEAAPASEADAPVRLPLAAVNADFSQEGFDAALAIDGKADTGWAVEGFNRRGNRTAVFVPRSPFGYPGGTRLVVRLKHESKFAKHNIGRFRISVTTDPAMAPADFGTWYVSGPYVAEEGKSAHDTAYDPESGVDLQARSEDHRLKWVAASHLVDGQENYFAPDVPGAVYLYRVIQSPSARDVTLSLGRNDTLKIWLNDALVHENAATTALAPDQEKVNLRLVPGENRLLMKVSSVGGKHGFYFRNAFEQVGEVPLAIETLLTKAVEERTEDEAAALRAHYRREHWPEWKPLEAALAKVEEEYKAFDASVPTVMVMAELEEPRETFILNRGQYDQPGEKVVATVPAVLPGLPEDAPGNRLTLAKWLVDPKHPLTARVVVNRYWQRFFGTGIVKTVQDFGLQGEWPVHPELLDWLATEFVRSGWDVKHMHRLMVTSATYRQASRSTPELNDIDPENRLLARGPRMRLDAETIRDNALFISGLLVEKIGGPSVKPYQPAGLWEEVSYGDPNFTAQSFEQDHGEALYRRSMYTFWKRTAPPPSMVLFDAPNREVCTVRRARTNTPLQALALMNDVQYVEAARALAERTLKECAGTPEERVAWAFRLATARTPGSRESEVLLGLLEAQLETYRQDVEAAKQLLSVGEKPCDENLDPAELAAWTTVASAILNLDETVTKG